MHVKYRPVRAFEVAAVKERLREAGGGYEIVHKSAELHVVLEGTASSRLRANRYRSERAAPVFVEAHAEHRFTAYEHLSVLVIFEQKPADNP